MLPDITMSNKEYLTIIGCMTQYELYITCLKNTIKTVDFFPVEVHWQNCDTTKIPLQVFHAIFLFSCTHK